MAAFDNSYSRIIFWLKIALPLLALAVLSTLFLFSPRVDIDGALPYSEVDVEQLAREQRLTQPEYTSVMATAARCASTPTLRARKPAPTARLRPVR